MNYITYKCEACHRRSNADELYYCYATDQYLCDNCISQQDQEPLDPPGWEGGFADNH